MKKIFSAFKKKKLSARKKKAIYCRIAKSRPLAIKKRGQAPERFDFFPVLPRRKTAKN